MLSEAFVTKRLLLVEDTPVIAKLQSVIAERAGYIVDVAGSKAEAARLLSNQQYDCAVVDYLLPDANEGEAIDVVLAANLQTIVMTAQLNNAVRENIQKKPIVDYITKENHQSYHYLEKRLISLIRNRHIKVLVVDKDPASNQRMCALLTRQAYKVLSARGAKEALALLEQHDIAAVITDNELSTLNGNELCALIREKYSPDEVIVIGISTAEKPNLSARFLKNGANDFLRKPFNEEEFNCRVNINLDLAEQFEQVRRQANEDALTGLANRRYFFHKAKQAMKVAEQQALPVNVAMMDLDKFKSINDTYGHSSGDEVLKQLASLMTEFFEGHEVARLGGEEFAVLFDPTAKLTAEQVESTCNRFR